MTAPHSTRLRTARKILTIAVFSSLCGLVQAEDLLQIFNVAVNKDPEIRQARANFNAQHTRLDQGRSVLMPTISLTGRTSRDTNGVDGAAPTGGFFPSPSHSFANGYNNKGYGLSLRQNLLNFEAWYTWQSTKKADLVAELTLTQAEQNLIMRVATAYFDVLRSKTNLASFTAEEEASLQVLEQTRQRFEVGLIPITDVYESQANADLANVNKLVEENNLSQRYEALEAITGTPYSNVAGLSTEFPITTADTSLNEWTSLALENNIALQSAEIDFEAKKDDARAAKAAMLPTLELNAQYNWSQSGNVIGFNPNLPTINTGITLNFSMPLFAGGLNRARMRQAYYLRDASEESLLLTRRNSLQTIRNSYRSVETDVRAVAARAQAIVSAQSALEATLVGLEVGSRNAVEVVLSQRTLFQAQRDYANARFTYVIDTLNLKQAAGTLNPQDMIEINEWLVE